MGDEVLMGWLIGFVDFWLGLFGDIVCFCVTWGLLAGLFYVVCRYFVCGNDKQQWADMKSDMQSGLRDMARTFRDAMPGIHVAAKRWADEKVGKKG